MADGTRHTRAASSMREDGAVKRLRDDPAFAREYLTAALEKADPENGLTPLVASLRHVAEAQGMYSVAQYAGIPREALHRALAPGGEPSIQVVFAVLHAAGLELSVRVRGS